MKISFFCKVDRSALSVVEFYKQDIEILKSLGHEIKIATSYKEIDWSSNIIFIWWWTYALYPVVRARLSNKRTIITGTFNYRAPDSTGDFFRRPLWQRILIKKAIQLSSINILVSKNEFNQIEHDWKLKNMYYSPHVVDVEKYIPNNGNRRNSNYFFSIIWTGRFNLQRKCLPEILESAKIVLTKRPELKFYIAGRKGDGFEKIKKIIDDLGLANNVLLLGEISEEKKIQYLQDCLIYLQPSKYEGFGLAIAEAMSCGAPVITSDVGEVKNVVGNSGVFIFMRFSNIQ